MTTKKELLLFTTYCTSDTGKWSQISHVYISGRLVNLLKWYSSFLFSFQLVPTTAAQEGGGEGTLCFACQHAI